MQINVVYNENCLDTLLRMPDDFIDLTVTSPPYDNLRQYNGYEMQFGFIGRELYRITKKGGILVWVVGDATINRSETGTSFKQALYFMKCGFKLHDTMIYRKLNFMPLNHNRYEQEFEYMFVFSKGTPKTFYPISQGCKYYGKDSDRTGQYYKEHDERMRRVRSNKNRTNIKPYKIKGNIWEYKTGFIHATSDRVAFKHPAIFPEQLAADHIYSWSNEGDLIYDPFAGSGTVPKMCLKMNRNFIASEISSEYVDIIRERLLPHNLIVK